MKHIAIILLFAFALPARAHADAAAAAVVDHALAVLTQIDQQIARLQTVVPARRRAAVQAAATRLSAAIDQAKSRLQTLAPTARNAATVNAPAIVQLRQRYGELIIAAHELGVVMRKNSADWGLRSDWVAVPYPGDL